MGWGKVAVITVIAVVWSSVMEHKTSDDACTLACDHTAAMWYDDNVNCRDGHRDGDADEIMDPGGDGDYFIVLCCIMDALRFADT